MCGITAYFGKDYAVKTVLDSLAKLEYRGYDSFGFAYNSKGTLEVKKFVGKISEANVGSIPEAFVVIGHTRWATHGRVDLNNAHPHLSNNGNIAVVHNGIIENYHELKAELEKQGFKLKSETDSEIIPQLIELHMRSGKDFKEATKDALLRLKGSFAVVILEEDFNGFIAARKESPLVLGFKDENEFFAASDPVAFLDYTNKVVFLEDNELAVVENSSWSLVNLSTRKKVTRNPETVNWSAEQAKKGNYPHFMIKEIWDQPFALRNASRQDSVQIQKVARVLENSDTVYIIGCGSSFHASLTGAYWFSSIANKRVIAVLASEFDQHVKFLDKNSTIIALSQSGETADVLHALKNVKEKGTKIISLCNSQSSSLVRMADHALPINCGPEFCVLATKSYTAQLAVLFLLANALQGSFEKAQNQLKDLVKLLPKVIEVNLEKAKSLAAQTVNTNSYFALGRNIMYPSALEAAIKIKEVSYIHAEGFAGAELKHGSIALIEENTPVIVMADINHRDQLLSNAQEVKTRGAYVIGIDSKNAPVYDAHFEIPGVGELQPILSSIPVQLLAYQLALEKDLDPDKPRNLAKCVSVL